MITRCESSHSSNTSIQKDGCVGGVDLVTTYQQSHHREETKKNLSFIMEELKGKEKAFVLSTSDRTATYATNIFWQVCL